jgi:trk system potassium uptake protein TrkH
LFEHVGIDVVVSPKASALTEVLNRSQAQKVDVIALIEQDAAIGFVGTAATIGSIGPGFGAIGPIGSFGNLHLATKIIFTVDMIVGRLELIPFLAMLSPEFWSFARN